MTRIKLCGFTREADVDAAVELGVDFVGFVRHRKSARYVQLDRARELVSRITLPHPVLVYRWVKRPDHLPGTWQQAESFGRWSSSGDRPRILVVRAGAKAVPGRLPEQMELIKATNFSYDLGTSVVTAETLLESVQAILIDAFVPGVGGGTGVRVDMGWAAEYTSKCEYDVILAGGLDPDNVAKAIRTVRPYAVDVSSGIESSPGVKDRGKMKAFVEAVRAADREL